MDNQGPLPTSLAEVESVSQHTSDGGIVAMADDTGLGVIDTTS